MKTKMKHTFSKHFTHTAANWDSDQMIFDQNHSCIVDISIDKNTLDIISYTGDKEKIIGLIKAWFHDFQIPYMIICEKEFYTPFPETEYLIHYYKEIQSLHLQNIHAGFLHILFNIEQHCLDVYHETIEWKNKIISLTKYNFEIWKKEMKKEKEKVEIFKARLENHMEQYPTPRKNVFRVRKTWENEDWYYHIYIDHNFHEKELSEEVFEKIIVFYNSSYAVETVFKTLVKEIEKLDPYVFVGKSLCGGMYRNIFAFGEDIIFTVDKTNYKTKTVFDINDIAISVPNSSYLLQTSEEIKECVTTLMKPIKSVRLSSIMDDSYGEERAIVMMLQRHFKLIKQGDVTIDYSVRSKQKAFEEIRNHFKKDMVIVLETIEDHFETENYRIEAEKLYDFVITEKIRKEDSNDTLYERKNEKHIL